MLGERRMLHLAASLADHAPVSLGEAITGIDDHNVDLLLTAIGHAHHRETTGEPEGHTRSTCHVR